MSLSLETKLALLAIIGLILVILPLIPAIQRFRGRRRSDRLDATRSPADGIEPEAIRLERLRPADWDLSRDVTRQVTAWRRLGFRVIGVYRVPEIPGLRLVGLGHPADGFGAVVRKDASGGLSCEVFARSRNGDVWSVSSASGGELSSRPGHQVSVAPRRASPKRFCEALARDLPADDFLPVDPASFAGLVESTHAGDVAWRREHLGALGGVPRDPELDALSEPLFQKIRDRDLAGVETLLGRGVPLDGRDTGGRTPLMAAIVSEDPQLVTALLKSGADPNARAPGLPGLPADPAASQALVTPLTLAIETGEPQIAAAVLNAGANLLGPGEPPLCFAAREGDLDMVRAVVDAGAPIDQEDSEGVKPLHHAAIEGHVEVVEYLVSAGADVHAGVDGGRETAVTLAAAHGAVDVVELFELYVRRPQIKRARKILRSSNPAGDARARRLLNAAMNGRALMAKKLLASGLHPDTLDEGDGVETTTALMVAAQGAHVDTMRALLEAGADVHRHSSDGLRVIDHLLAAAPAAEPGRLGPAIRLLVHYGAELSHLDPEARARVDAFLSAS